MKPLRYVVGCLAAMVGAVGLIAWMGVFVAAIARSPWFFAWLAAAVGLTGAASGIYARVRPPAPPWDAPIRAAIAALPPGTQVRRSRVARVALASSLAWGAYLAGLFAAVYVFRNTPGAELAALGIVGAAGLIAGTLLAISRDGYGRTAGIVAVLGLPATISTWSIIHGVYPFGRYGGLRSVVLDGVLVGLVTGFPVVVGFAVPRWLVAVHRGRQAADMAITPVDAGVPHELEWVTDHRRAPALLRIYEVEDEGTAYLESDRVALDLAGYRLAQTCESGKGSSGLTRIVASAIAYRGGDDGVIAALFVRKDLRQR